MSFTKQQHKELMEALDASIERRVNGGIREISRKLENYIKDDTAWKADAKPAIENMKNVTGAWKLLIAFLLTIGGVAGAITTIRKLFI